LALERRSINFWPSQIKPIPGAAIIAIAMKFHTLNGFAVSCSALQPWRRSDGVEI
jgi:hypothetical protein